MPQRVFQKCSHRRLSLFAVTTALAGSLLLPASAGLAQEAGSERKWSGWLEMGGKIGTERSLGQFDIYAPAWQDKRSLALVNLRMVGDNHSSMEGNLGVIYRRMLDSGWNLGGYGYLDVRRSEHDNTFHQATLGVEALGPDFDVRANAYVPFGAQWQDVPGESELDIQGGELQLRQGEERALYGADAEVGARVPVFEREGPLDLRVYAGGYHFDGADAESVTGPRGRMELDIFDLPGLSPNARVTASAEAQWDEPRGSQGFLGLSLSIPLQGDMGGSDARPRTRQERRMMAPVVRDVDIVTEAGPSQRPETTEDVKNVATGVEIGEVVEVAGGGDNLAEALADAEENGLVIAKGDDGELEGDVALEDGQTLIGGGHDLAVRGVDSGQTLTYSAPGRRGTVSHDSDAVVTLADNSYVGGLDLRGGGTSAASDNRGVYGGDGIDNVTLAGNDIAETGGNGIAFGDFVTAVNLNDNEVSKTEEAGIDFGIGAGDGIFGDGVLLRNNEISTTGVDGISFGDGAGADGGSVTLSGNKIGGTDNESSIEGHGVAFDDFAGSYEGRVTLSNNEISETNGDGVRFGDGAGGESGSVMLSDNAISGTGEAGISFGEGAGAVDGLAMLSGNEIVDTGNEPAAVGHGVFFDDFAGIDEGHVSLKGNEISGTGDDGISFGDDTGPEDGGVSLSSNEIEETGEDGVSFGGNADGVAMTENRISGIGAHGISFGTQATDIGLIGNEISATDGDGIRFGNDTNWAALVSNQMHDAGGRGISFGENAADIQMAENSVSETVESGMSFGPSSRDVILVGNKVSNAVTSGNPGGGIYFGENVEEAILLGNRVSDSGYRGIAFAENAKELEIEENFVSGSYQANMRFASGVERLMLSENRLDDGDAQNLTFGGDARQVKLLDNTILRSGTEVQGTSVYFNAGEIRDLEITGNRIVGTSGNGISLAGDVEDALLSNNVISDAESFGVALSGDVSDVMLRGNEISDTDFTAISFPNTSSNVQILDNEISDAGGGGVYFSTFGGIDNSRDITVSGNGFEGEIGDDLFELNGGTFSGKDNVDDTERIGGEVCDDSSGSYSGSEGFEIDAGGPVGEDCGAGD